MTSLTNGWDTVYAIRLDDVNKAIQKRQADWPTDAKGNSSSSTGTYTLTANLGNWRVGSAAASGGGILDMKVDIPSGTLEKVPTTGPTVTLDLTGLSVSVQVGLNWVAAAGDTTRLLLPSDLIVSAITGQLDPTSASVVKQMLRTALVDAANQGKFRAALVAINIGAAEASGTLTWLLPNKHVGFAVSIPTLDSPTLNNSFLAVLAMTENRVPTNLTQEVSAFAIPGTDRAGFVIDKRLFFEKMVKPGIAALFADATVADFELYNDNKGIRNTRDLSFVKLHIPAASISPARDVTPTIAANNFSLEIDGSQLVLRMVDFAFEWQAGVNIKIAHTSRSSMSLSADKRILQIIEETTTSDSTAELETWVTVVSVLGGVVAAIGAAVIGTAIGAAVEGAAEGSAEVASDVATNTGRQIAMRTITTTASESASESETSAAALALQDVQTAGKGAQAEASPMLGFFSRNSVKLKAGLLACIPGVAIGVPLALTEKILEWQATGQTEKIPTLDTLATAAVKPVTWPDQAAFKLTSVTLNDALQLGGDPFPPTI